MMSKEASASMGPDQYKLGKQAVKMVTSLLNETKTPQTPIKLPKLINKEILPNIRNKPFKTFINGL